MGKRTKLIVSIVTILVAAYAAPPFYIHISSKPTDTQGACLPGGERKDPKEIERPDESGLVKVIKMTDLGEFEDRCQLTDALYSLNWDRIVYPPPDYNAIIKKNAISKPKLAVLYIHGWRNDEREISGDLPKFRALMKNLAENNSDKQLIGIYIAWNAHSDIPVWNILNFWQKKGVADRIAASANVTNVISAASEIIARSEVGGRLITIGHSFGARILMASTIQTAIAATQAAHPGRVGGKFAEIKSMSQTTIFLNPAFEAAYFTPFAALHRGKESFSNTQKPVLLTVTTSDDLPTRWAFPLGQAIDWKTGRKELRTLGNYRPYWTHELTTTSSLSCRGTGAGVGLTEQFFHGEACLRRTGSGTYNPFMVVRTEPSILSGHSGIWNPKFVDWLFGYLDQLAKQLPKKTEADPH